MTWRMTGPMIAAQSQFNVGERFVVKSDYTPVWALQSDGRLGNELLAGGACIEIGSHESAGGILQVGCRVLFTPQATMRSGQIVFLFELLNATAEETLAAYNLRRMTPLEYLAHADE